MSEVDKTSESEITSSVDGASVPASKENGNGTTVDANGQHTQDQKVTKKKLTTTITENGKRASALDEVKKKMFVVESKKMERLASLWLSLID